MFPIGLSSCATDDIFALIAQCAQAGVCCMELSMHTDELAELDFAALRDCAKQHGVRLWSMHIPFSPFDVLDPSDPEKQETTLAYFTDCITKGADIGIDKFVIHPSAEPIEEEDRPRRMACAKESFAYLADFAAQKGGVIAVENLPRTCLGRDSKDILDLLSAHPALRVCYDTNHLLSEPAADFLAAVGDKIITTHVSDYDFLNERHWLPGEGKVNWQEILSMLAACGYKGAWLYELGFGMSKTRKRQRVLTTDDVVCNANELFAGKTPTLLSEPVEGLQGWK